MAHNILRQQTTPSVYFNFSPSQSKTPLNVQEYIPLEYSNTINKKEISTQQNHPLSKKIQFEEIQASLQSSYGKINTEELFDQFDHHFVVKFDEEGEKFQEKEEREIKHYSNIEKPSHENVENEEQNTKTNTLQNLSSTFIRNHHKKPFQIHKRVAFKNQINLSKNCSSKAELKQHNKDIIKQQNLLVVTSNCWTGVGRVKNAYLGSKTTKNTLGKSLIKDSLFHSHGVFKETLRSTTLDHWRKKHGENKKMMIDKKKGRKQLNIFQKPFRLR